MEKDDYYFVLSQGHNNNNETTITTKLKVFKLGVTETLDVSALEDALNKHICIDPPHSVADTTTASTKEQRCSYQHEDDDEYEPVVFQTRYDAHWLDCRPPNYYPPISILGIPEDYDLDSLNNNELLSNNDNEDDDNNNDYFNLKLNLASYKVSQTTCSNDTNSATATAAASYTCCAPHSKWERKPITNKNSNHFHNNTIDMAWIDFRSIDNFNQIYNTKESILHFFRSLFGISHSVSPWCCHHDNNNNNSEQQSLLSLSQSDNDNHGNSKKEPSIAVLVLAHPPKSLFVDFLVGDASPSWYLHATASIHINDDATVTSWLDKPQSSTTTNVESLQVSTILVYKKLNPRDWFLSHHPTNSIAEPTIPGCLWETYYIKPAENSDKEQQQQQQQQNKTEQETNEEQSSSSSSSSSKPCHRPTIELTQPMYRQISPPYVSFLEEFPFAQELFSKHSLETFRQEALSIPQWTAWPETQHYHSENGSGESSWTVFPLCYCFPAYELQKRKFIPLTSSFVPKTTALLKSILGDSLRTALFSRLLPNTTLSPHTGWEDLANHVLRLHIPLVVPPNGVCGVWVDGCVETHEVYRPICFDDSKIHRAFNYSEKESRIVLIVDVARPDQLPRGTATGGHTDELDKFINQMTGG